MTKNKNGFKIVDPEVKHIKDPVVFQKKYKSFNKLVSVIKTKMEKLYMFEKVNNDKARISIEIILDAITSTIPIKYMINKDENVNAEERLFFTIDFETNEPVWIPLKINKFTSIASIVDPKINLININREIDQRFADTPDSLLKMEKLKLPPDHICLFPNGVFNFKTFEFANDINYFGEYDFINSNFMNLVTTDLTNPLKLELANRILNDWSANDEKSKIYLMQKILAAIEGNGRKTYHIICASGGNGKSSFLNILENCAGKKYTVKLNLQDIINDNKVNRIGIATKFIVGHDLATNYKMSHLMISRLKELITQEAFLADVKYKDAKLIKSNALMVQSTNTKPEIFENSKAMKRRLRIFPWPDVDFTKNNDSDELDLLIGTIGTADPEFYEALLAICIENTKPFKEFIKLDIIDHATNELISESDQVYNFMTYLQEQDLTYNIIPSSILYAMFNSWQTVENPGAKPMKRRYFTTKVLNVCEEFGYQFDKTSTGRNRIKSISSLDYPHEYNTKFFRLKDINVDEQSACLFKNDKVDFSEKVKNVENLLSTGELLSLDDVSTETLIILYHLKEQGNLDAITILNLD